MKTTPKVTSALLDALLLKTSRTFALSIPELPEPTRREVTVAYLLFRIADTLEDATAWAPAQQKEELRSFGALLSSPDANRARALAERWTADPPLSHPGYRDLLLESPAVVRAFLELSDEARTLVRDHTLRTIDSMAGFVTRCDVRRNLQLRDIGDLKAYCYAVAGIVGEMLTELFLLGERRLAPIAPLLRQNAATFGEALQLVNILKDSSSDAQEGRRYVPSSVDRREVFALAREDLEAARGYVLALQRAGAPRGFVAFTALPVLLAWGTLTRVEAQGPSAKLTRPEVAEIVVRLHSAIESNEPALPEMSTPRASV